MSWTFSGERVLMMSLFSIQRKSPERPIHKFQGAPKVNIAVKRHNMTIVPERRTPSTTSSFASSCANPPSLDYTRGSSNYTPRPSRPIADDDDNSTRFPFPTLLGEEIMDPDKSRPTPVRRASKLNLLSKLFSSSKREVKDSKKPKDKGGNNNNNNKTASPTTFRLSRDAAQVFGTLRQQQPQQNGPPLGIPKRGLVRQTSETSMIGSVLEIPSSATASASSTLEETAQEVPPVVLETTCATSTTTAPTRPKLEQRASSFRTPSRINGGEFHRTPSTRSVSFTQQQQEAPPLKPPPARPADNLCEITPGNFHVLRGHQETLQYVRQDKIASTTCPACSDTVYSINDAAMVVCPTCRSIAPTQIENGDGLALGFSAYDWFDIQRESGMTMP